MIYVLRLIDGTEVIGDVECEESLEGLEYINIVDPMDIIDGQYEDSRTGMRLRDSLMLSDNDMLTFNQKHVITYYKPSINLESYYKTAVDYSKRVSKAIINEQIAVATFDMENLIKEEEDYKSQVSDYLQKLISGSLH